MCDLTCILSAAALTQRMYVQYGAGISKTVECPQTMVGRVIGKGGETIKALQKHFGCNIQIDQQSNPMSLTVAGQPSAVEGAMAACQEILAGGNPPFLGGPLGGAPAGFPGGTCWVTCAFCLSVRCFVGVCPELQLV